MSIIDEFFEQVEQDYQARNSSMYLQIANDWLRVENRIKAELTDLTILLEEKRLAGEVITQQMLWKQDYYRRLIVQAEEQYAYFSSKVAMQIASAQEKNYLLGAQVANNSMDLLYHNVGVFSPFWEVVDESKVKNIAGLLYDRRSPVYQLLDSKYSASKKAMTDALIEGSMRGYVPSKVAQMAVEASSIGLKYALRIANTELSRAYRMGVYQQFKQSKRIKKYRRYVNKAHACPACLALDGEIIAINQEPYDHPNGMCNFLPVIEGVPDQDWLKGEDWLKQQTEERQRQILGNTRFDIWKGGVPLEKFATTTTSPIWGKNPSVKTLKQLSAEGLFTPKVKKPAALPLTTPPPDLTIPRHLRPTPVPTEQEMKQYLAARAGGNIETEIKARIAHATNDVNSPVYKMTAAQAREYYEKELKAVVANSELCMRCPPGAFNKVLDEGRFKSQFETGKSGGTLDISMRRDAEKIGLGLPENLEFNKRPVYGYLEYKGQEGSVSMYGDIKIILNKDAIINRSTMTVGDSLRLFDGGEAFGTPLSNPGIEGMTEYDAAEKIVQLIKGGVKDTARYLEMQVYHGVSVTDIKEVVFMHRIDMDIAKKLDAQGIKWSSK